MSLIILVEYTEGTLLENGSGDYDTVRRVGQGSHFKEASLIETTAEKVDSMTVVKSLDG
jgi:hypothetical protein